MIILVQTKSFLIFFFDFSASAYGAGGRRLAAPYFPPGLCFFHFFCIFLFNFLVFWFSDVLIFFKLISFQNNKAYLRTYLFNSVILRNSPIDIGTGSADRTVKIWDLAKCVAGAEGGLKLTLTGHINAIRGLAISERTTYMFTAGEDKKVMCWDLEVNKVVRHYHGHLSGVYGLCLHPTLDLLITGGRDSCARVWDIRTSKQVMMLGGHTNTVGALASNAVDPQVITGSHDCTVKLWDLAKGKAMTTLTHHKKAIRDLVASPFDFSFVTAAADNLKHWQSKDGTFLHNYVGHNAIINAVAVNQDEVLVSGGDDGSLRFWDYKTGYNFQQLRSPVQPGSLECENAIYAMAFDKSGSRLVTCEADKSIKIYKEDTDADPLSHPVDMKSWTAFCRTLRRV